MCRHCLTLAIISGQASKTCMLPIVAHGYDNFSKGDRFLLPVQGLRWMAEDCQAHLFPKLRLKIRPNLVQLAGGTRGLPITDPKVSQIKLLQFGRVNKFLPFLKHPGHWHEIINPGSAHGRGFLNNPKCSV